MKEFNWKEFLNTKNNVAVHCQTEKEAIDFCKLMDAHELIRHSGNSYIINTHWDSNKEDTIYYNTGDYSSLRSPSSWGYRIYDWSDFMNNEFTKDSLKTGMFLKCRNGAKYEVLRDTPNGDVLMGEGGYNNFYIYGQDLKVAKSYQSSFDIIEVRVPNGKYQYDFSFWDAMETIWRRKPEHLVGDVKLSLQENFRVMWIWLSDHPDKSKKDYFEANDFVEPMSLCFACEAALDEEGCTDCRRCPLRKKTSKVEETMNPLCLIRLYQEWIEATGFQKALLAHQISELDWKEVE